MQKGRSGNEHGTKRWEALRIKAGAQNMTDTGQEGRLVLRIAGQELVGIPAQLQNVLDGERQQTGSHGRGIAQDVGPEDGAEGRWHGEGPGACGHRSAGAGAELGHGARSAKPCWDVKLGRLDDCNNPSSKPTDTGSKREKEKKKR